jgi:hypothetical protein
MNPSHIPFIRFATAVLASAGLSTAVAQTTSSRPTVLTPPAVNNGSNWSRAPLPAARQFDDVKRPDGQAVDKLPSPDPSINDTPPPPPTVAIFQSKTAPGFAAEPGLMPTGRPTTAISASIDSATVAPAIRSTMFASRDAVLRDIDARLSSSEHAMSSLRGTTSQMSAEGRQSFDAAHDEVKARAKALKKSIKTARHASEAEWESARAQLAADYEAYAAALARVDTAAGLPPATR